MKKMRREIFAGSAVAVLLLTAGCGLSDKPSGKNPAVQPVSDSKQLGSAYPGADAYGSGAGSGYGDASASPAGGAAKNSAAGQLKVSQIANLGAAVTDGEGFTLYRFDKDTAKPPKSACEGDCAKVWPAVSSDDASAGEGIEAGMVGSVTRADGSKQLTLGGWPVYRYAKDTKAGDTLGEGVGGTWHAVGPTGKPATAGGKAADAPANSGGTSMDMGSGYGSGSGSGTGTGTGADAAAGAADSLWVRKNPKLGNILADGQGRTLYRFDKDSAWPMKFGCLDSCLDTWKPAAPTDKSKVAGISAELVGSVKRPDGSEQLTIDCWPVYTFTGDKTPGDINGHNKQGLWFAVTDQGKKAKATG
ncbi:SCO0930 family lipoprotein [Streptomyces sp. NPDC088097]|uniref:SCO0930 family lipoprotein n=1 Tax=Streptomyces sp. NPDC088097 TaxID=3365823 RepID=UPI00382B1078